MKSLANVAIATKTKKQSKSINMQEFLNKYTFFNLTQLAKKLCIKEARLRAIKCGQRKPTIKERILFANGIQIIATELASWSMDIIGQPICVKHFV